MASEYECVSKPAFLLACISFRSHQIEFSFLSFLPVKLIICHFFTLKLIVILNCEIELRFSLIILVFSLSLVSSLILNLKYPSFPYQQYILDWSLYFKIYNIAHHFNCHQIIRRGFCFFYFLLRDILKSSWKNLD